MVAFQQQLPSRKALNSGQSLQLTECVLDYTEQCALNYGISCVYHARGPSISKEIFILACQAVFCSWLDFMLLAVPTLSHPLFSVNLSLLCLFIYPSTFLSRKPTKIASKLKYLFPPQTCSSPKYLFIFGPRNNNNKKPCVHLPTSSS